MEKAEGRRILKRVQGIVFGRDDMEAEAMLEELGRAVAEEQGKFASARSAKTGSNRMKAGGQDRSEE